VPLRPGQVVRLRALALNAADLRPLARNLSFEAIKNGTCKVGHNWYSNYVVRTTFFLPSICLMVIKEINGHVQ